MAPNNTAKPPASASDLRRAQAGAEKGAVSGDVSETCESCIAEDCRKKIEEIDRETKEITRISDPIERNKAITAAYTKLAAEDPQNRWIKLASIVSTQGGCAMKKVEPRPDRFPTTTDPTENLFSPFTKLAATSLYHALGEANKAIFEDIYPMVSYRARYGHKSLKACYEILGKDLPDDVDQSFTALENGDLSGASNFIAEYEQGVVVQRVYDDHSLLFNGLELYNSGQKLVTHKNEYDIPVSTICGDENSVPFVGNISDKDARIKYYRKLMARLSEQQGW